MPFLITAAVDLYKPVGPTNVQDAIGVHDKNSSGDEIANVNLSTTISHMYFKIPNKLQYFV